jgi:hypothetical protein
MLRWRETRERPGLNDSVTLRDRDVESLQRRPRDVGLACQQLNVTVAQVTNGPRILGSTGQ